MLWKPLLLITQFCWLNFIRRVTRGSLRRPGWNERCKLWTAQQVGRVIFNIYFNWKFYSELITCGLHSKILNVWLVYKFKLYCLWSYKNTNSGVHCTPKDSVTRQGPIWANLEGPKCNYSMVIVKLWIYFLYGLTVWWFSTRLRKDRTP